MPGHVNVSANQNRRCRSGRGRIALSAYAIGAYGYYVKIGFVLLKTADSRWQIVDSGEVGR